MNKNDTKNAKKALFCMDFSLTRKSTLIWIAIIAILMIITLSLYDMMLASMDSMPDDVKEMMDAMGYNLSFSNIVDYYIMEGMQTYILGGILFSAFLASNLIKSDFKHKYFESIYTQPLKRTTFFKSKLLQLTTQVIAFNIILTIILGATMLIVNSENFAWSAYLLFNACGLFISLSVAYIIFAISCLKPSKGNTGLSIGLPLILYFVTIISKLIKSSQNIEVLDYFSPISIIANANATFSFASINFWIVAIWFVLPLICLFFAHKKFNKIDFN